MSFGFGILGRKMVLQYPCINLDCILNSNVLHGLFPSEKGNASERPVSLFHVLFYKCTYKGKIC